MKNTDFEAIEIIKRGSLANIKYGENDLAVVLLEYYFNLIIML